MKKNYDFYADAKKNWNNGEGLPDACDILRATVNENANTILTYAAEREKMTEDVLFRIWGADIKFGDSDLMKALKSLGLPEGTSTALALGHPVWQNLVIVSVIKLYE